MKKDFAPYRYILEREMPAPLFGAPGMKGGKKTASIIMLNPSTATAEKNDPTITRLLGFAAREGWEKLYILNLFARRETDKAAFLKAAKRKPLEAVGEKNDAAFRHVLFSELGRGDRRPLVVIAWGNVPAWARVRELQVYKMLRASELPVFSLGTVTADGHPRHPLYLKSDTELCPRDPRLEVKRLLNQGVKNFF